MKIPAVLALALCVLLHASSAFAGGSLYDVPMQWQDDKGSNVTLADFKGRPVILTLAYTQCKSACPMTMQRLNHIAQQLDAKESPVQLVVVSLDPEHDSPEALAHFRQQYRFTGPRWHFLRGSEQDLRTLSVLVGYSYQHQGGEIMHSNKMVLLDSKGEPFSSVEGLGNTTDALVSSALSLPSDK